MGYVEMGYAGMEQEYQSAGQRNQMRLESNNRKSQLSRRMKYMSNGLEALFEYEKGKWSGILNGIDVHVWDPATDTYLDEHQYSVNDAEAGKAKNKMIFVSSLILISKNH